MRQRFNVFHCLFCAKVQTSVFFIFFIDKSGVLCLNRHNRTNIKTVMENLPFLKVSESRRQVRAGTEGFGNLIPESIL